MIVLSSCDIERDVGDLGVCGVRAVRRGGVWDELGLRRWANLSFDVHFRVRELQSMSGEPVLRAPKCKAGSNEEEMEWVAMGIAFRSVTAERGRGDHIFASARAHV
eukprot:2998201-Prymnesium_polylepis.1